MTDKELFERQAEWQTEAEARAEQAARRKLTETVLYNFTLTGDYATDDKRVTEVQALVEKFDGEFELNYAHKANLYRFEIGGRFEPTQVRQFKAAMGAWHNDAR